MNIVKLTCPVEWNLDVPGLKTQFHRLTPGLSGAWGDYTFLINDDSKECDYWLVYGFLEKPETVTVRKNTILLLSEEIGIKKWDDNFMAQFDIVSGSQTQINHPHYIHDHYVCGWQVQKSYDQLKAINPIPKTKLLSIIASNMRATEGHRRRHDFVTQLKDHFKDRVDWYGKGNNFIADKWDGLSDYKFSVAIENQQIENYWTEKIADCFLAYTIPVYYGCTNIDKLFPQGSYLNIDLDNVHKSIDTIEEALAGDYYERNLGAVKEARELIINKYQLMPMVAGWLEEIEPELNKSRKITLYPETNFVKLSLLNRVKSKIQRTFNS